VKEIKRVGLSGYDFSAGMPYIKDLWISNNGRLMNEVKKPEFLKFLKLEDAYLSYTAIGTNKNVKGKAKQLNSESYFC
jgi:hypothetical protein